MKMHNTGRNKLTAAVLGLLMPGLGQVYNGELLKGACIMVIYIAFFLTGMQLSMRLPDGWLPAGLILTLAAVIAVYLLSALEAYRRAAATTGNGGAKVYNKWYFYAASCLLGSVLVMGAVYGYAHEHIAALYKIPSESMQPRILRGDRIIVDNTAYKRFSPARGDVIVFVYLDDRSKIYIKRIAALPGETVKLQDGKDFVVPHGHIYVLGDNAGNSKDSRDFGPVPLRDVLGKARLVCWSQSPQGFRWSRMGLALKSEAR